MMMILSCFVILSIDILNSVTVIYMFSDGKISKMMQKMMHIAYFVNEGVFRDFQ